MDEEEKKQIKEHIRTLEYVCSELEIQHNELNNRIENLKHLIFKERMKLRND